MELSTIKKLLRTYIIDSFPYSEICFDCNDEDCYPSYEECQKRVEFESKKKK
jgi:hypothetical protein